MAMEIGGNFPDYSVRKQNYSGYGAQSMAGSGAADSAKKKGTEKSEETAGSRKSKSTAEYVRELAKLVPSVEFKVGNTFSTAKNGRTLTVNPQLLEKMLNDPETEKKMKELIKGVEAAERWVESYHKATGGTTVFRHSYIDENGNFRSYSYIRKDDKLNEKLREERQKNSEKLIEKTKEKAVEKKEELEETLEEKLAASKDGRIYLNDTDIWTIIEAVKKDNTGRAITKEQPQAGANLDLRI